MTKTPADEFCDSVLAAMHKEGATFADREMVDKVMRPFYHAIDAAYERKENAVEFCAAMEAVVTMMISNFVARVASGNFEAAQDATQEIVNNIALRLNDDLVNQQKKLQQTAEIIILPSRNRKDKLDG